MNGSGRIPELDGIRGVAIGMVLIWHYFFLTISTRPGSLAAHIQALGRLTWTGVDLFFVLSGFLIGGILLDSRNSGNYFRTFYTRRFFRIVPAYSAVLCFAWILVWSTGPAGRKDFVIAPWYLYGLFAQNFWMVGAGTLGFFGATWSLCIEEQFYLTFPAIVRYLDRRLLPYALAGGILAAPLFRMFLFYKFPLSSLGAFVLTPCRMDALLLGVGGAYALRNERSSRWIEQNGGVLWALFFFFLGIAAYLTKHFASIVGFPLISFGYTCMALLYLSFLLLAVTRPDSVLARILRWGWLNWLGSISYGVYLVHQLVAQAIFQTVWHSSQLTIHNLSTFVAIVLSLAISLVICRVSWRYFEKPLIDLGHRST